MKIRNFQAGDETIQAALYNEAAGALAKFKPATVQEVQRRSRARDFDPGTRFFVEDHGRVVGYANFNANGRVGFPWLLKGTEHLAEPLFEHVLQAMKLRGLSRAFAAYRQDWPTIHDFFLGHGFRKVRDMVNHAIDLVDMPTPPARPSSTITPLQRADVADLLALAPDVFQAKTVVELEKHIFDNPFFTSDALFVLRSRTGNALVAVGILVIDPSFADPLKVDANMPCYRLGAFGTEGMQCKRINGLFSFVSRPDQNITAMGLDLMGHAAYRLQETDDVAALAGQVPSDAPALLHFYERNFRRQGSFPVFEKEL